MDYLSSLNQKQKEAVTTTQGPVLVLAGAGSGKTRVLTHRICHLIRDKQIRPQRILAVTFTNKATKEMQERLHTMLGRESEFLWVSTFHSAGLRILRRYASVLGYTNNFTIYDDDDSKALLKDIIRRLKIDEKKNPVQSFSRAIDIAKNAGILPENFLEGHSFNRAFNAVREMQSEVYQIYQRELRQADAMDFGDLLLNSTLILEKDNQVRDFYQKLLEYILVDEFQDTNEIQYRFLRLLSAPQQNLFVVGDDDQSIYSFRGATVRNILEFDRDFPSAKVIALEQNYRSSANVLSAAHAVICKNSGRHKKKLWTEADAGSSLVQYIGMSEQEEAQFVVTQIKQHLSEGCKLSDFAIFYRTNAQSRALEEALLTEKITYRIFGGLRFYERKEIKDILSYVKLALNQKDNSALLRVINNPPRGIGAQTIAKITQTAQQRGLSYFEAARIVAKDSTKIEGFVTLIDKLAAAAPQLALSELIHSAIEESEYGPRLRAMTDPQSQSRVENLLELKALARNFEAKETDRSECLRQFLDRIALAAEETSASAQQESEDNKNFVSLMTLHLAKGLEYPIVFLTGVEEGLIPHYRSLYDPESLEEERRLCYVGITRAIKQLYISAAYSRGMFASSESYGGGYREPSRFLFDIPQNLWGEPAAQMPESEPGMDQIWDDNIRDDYIED